MMIHCALVFYSGVVVVSENPAGYVVLLMGGAFLELVAAIERKVP